MLSLEKVKKSLNKQEHAEARQKISCVIHHSQEQETEHALLVDTEIQILNRNFHSYYKGKISGTLSKIKAVKLVFVLVKLKIVMLSWICQSV